ncbi:MAG TPA: TRAM domain-containing protein [Candidatus Saccharimonadales bacterium]|jgi:23S rRNA (uracil1939-C5)-methyltransferase
MDKTEVVVIDKLVHGGQGLATLADGRKIFVWNALPGEKVNVRIIKTKKSYAEGIAEEILEPSAERVEPSEQNYLATSPWQMMTYEAENTYKQQIVEELFAHEKVTLPGVGTTVHDDRQWHYRSKMEYSFWGDDDGLHLALHQRGSHGKQIVQGSKLAMPTIDAAANAICAQLNTLNNGKGARAGDLKTIIIRCDQRGNAVGALYTKLDTFKELTLPAELQGLRVYHSNPKSPASVPTRLIYELGNCLLHDTLHDTQFVYDVDSFFQVNLPVFEKALTVIKNYVDDGALTDMYAGVGSIGLSIASNQVTLVELDPASARMAAQNASDNALASGLTAQVIEASTEKALEYITADSPVIFDPPRAGLHDKVVAAVLSVLPPKIIYLSCNPATHARDLAKLQAAYKIEHFEIFNFFPRTPHIETLAILKLK